MSVMVRQLPSLCMLVVILIEFPLALTGFLILRTMACSMRNTSLNIIDGVSAAGFFNQYFIAKLKGAI